MICMNNPKVFISYSWHPEENKIRGENCLALLESVLGGEESLPVLHDIYQQATALLKQFEKNKIKLSAKLQQTLTYMTKHWEELMAYVKIGSVLIDNNCCERAVLPFTNLRKNFGGFSSEQGARVTATYLTFVETCKLMVMAPLDFFRGFFDMIVAGRRDYALMTEALLVKHV